jgi:hypothetical protein
LRMGSIPSGDPAAAEYRRVLRRELGSRAGN